jgi:hypothetical protein
MSEGAGTHLAVALAAGAVVTKKESTGAAIKDRFKALKRAVSKKSDKIGLEDLESKDLRATLAKELEQYGAVKDKNVVESAKELLGLIKVDEEARGELGAALTKEVEAALVALAAVEVDEAPPPPKKTEKTEKTEKKADVPPPAPSTSRRFIPIDEPSKTELERTALPIHLRTDRFFLKVGVCVAAVVVAFIVFWVFIRVPPNDAMDRCKGGEAAKCWEVVAAQDTQEQGTKVSTEPLQILCEKHDPCGCAGLAYLTAAATPNDTTADCNGLAQATAIDPTWPCSCARYNFWRYGKNRTPQCGIMRCE